MRIIEAKPASQFQVVLRFADGTRGTADLNHLAGRGVFRIWEAPGVFEQLSITAEGALQWPGEVDLCPDSLYLQVTGKSPIELFPVLNESVNHA
jgi:hypothetical protein